MDTRIAAIDQVVAQILRDYEVLDISISDPPLEDIIAAIYSGNGEGFS